MVKPINPLYYPIALLAGGIVLVAGVRIWKLPNLIILPSSAIVAAATALMLKAIEPDPEKLAREEVARELTNLKVSGHNLALIAGFVRQEAGQILGREAEYLEVLVRIEEVATPLAEILPKIEELGRRLPRNTAVLSLAELEGDLQRARELLATSTGIAQEQAGELVRILERNLELAKTGNSLNLAKLLNLRTMMEDAAGILQELQNKVRTIRRRGVDRVQEIGESCDRLKSIINNLDILIH